MEMEAKCPFWSVCGGAMFHQYWARQIYPYGDPRRDWVGTVCNDEERYLECEHYQIRIKLKEAESGDELSKGVNLL